MYLQNQLNFVNSLALFCVVSVFRRCDCLLLAPFSGRHACDALEGSEEPDVGSEARLYGYRQHLLVRMFSKKLLSKVNAIGIDKLSESLAAVSLDAVGDIGAVSMEHVGNVL